MSDVESETERQLDERAFEDDKRAIEGPEDAEAAALSNQDLLVDVPIDADDIDLTHSRIKTLDGLPLSRYAPTLKKLCLRQNQITTLITLDSHAPLEALGELEDLDLYDNKIPHIEGLKSLSKLKTLDLSFNLIKHLPAELFDTLTSLRTLYLVQNKVAKISGLDGLATTLTSLELGGNRIRTIENLGALTNLTELWLGKNKITTLQGLDQLVNLKILSIQSNRITQMEGLDALVNLEELYISHNGLKTLSGLDHVSKLRVLDVCSNQIEHLENVAHLTELEEFWANDNKLSSLAEVEAELAPLKNLETVYLEGNPLQKTLGPTYRRKLIDLLPQVSQIDATFTKQA